MCKSGKRLDDVVDALVALQPPQVGEERYRRAGRGVRGVRRGIDAGIDHANGVRRDPARNKVVSCALTDRLERHAPVDGAERPLGEPDRGRYRNGQLVERRRSEEVRDECHGAASPPKRRVERNLVDVFDEHVEPSREMAAVVAARVEREGVARPDTAHDEAVERGSLWRPGPATAEERHLVTAGRQPAEDLVQVDLRAASLGVLAILPVDDENPH
jgi:hypothetical protein